MKLDVAVIGLLNIDIIVQGNAPKDISLLLDWTAEADITCLTAGSIGYFIQNIAKLGAKTGVIATIADDPFSLIIKKTLTDAGIDLSRLRIQQNTLTAIGVYILLFGNKKRPMTYRFMTHDLIPQFTDEDLEYIFNSRVLHIGGYLHFPQKKTFEDLIQKAVDQDVRISIDTQFPLKPLDPPWLSVLPDKLDSIDILLMDEREALGLTNCPNVEDAVSDLIKRGANTVAVKLGAKGCLVANQSEKIRKSAIYVENIVDSIGAGDSFDSGFIMGFLKGFSIEKMTDLALNIAAQSLEGVGGSSSIPSWEA